MNLYSRIRYRREILGMSQDELANRLGYKDRSTIAKIEAGVNDITQSKIQAFAKALNTTTAWLMGWDESSESMQITDDDVIIAFAYRMATEEEKAQIDSILYKYYQKL